LNGIKLAGNLVSGHEMKKYHHSILEVAGKEEYLVRQGVVGRRVGSSFPGTLYMNLDAYYRPLANEQGSVESWIGG
jgi:hypothetical protein